MAWRRKGNSELCAVSSLGSNDAKPNQDHQHHAGEEALTGEGASTAYSTYHSSPLLWPCCWIKRDQHNSIHFMALIFFLFRQQHRL